VCVCVCVCVSHRSVAKMESRKKTRVLQVRFRGAKNLIFFFLHASYVVLAARTALSESASSYIDITNGASLR